MDETSQITRLNRDHMKLNTRTTYILLLLLLLHCNGNCNCNWGTCIAPPTRRQRAHHSVNPYPGSHRQHA